MRYNRLDFRKEGAVATVRLARPEAGNQVDPDLAGELRAAFRAISEDADIRVVILTGSGGVFSAGRETPPAPTSRGGATARLAWLEGARMASSIAAVEIPVIVAINGDALDHGLELALAGDLRIASAEAHFGLTGLARGSFPWDGGTQRLPRLVGPAWARDMIFTGRIIDAAEALRLGLVNQVVEAERLPQAAHELAERILAGGPIAARYAKEGIQTGMELSLAQGLRLEADLNILLQSTADRAEGIESFLARRAPRFTGC
jgi:enoyl-CoA hydratase